MSQMFKKQLKQIESQEKQVHPTQSKQNEQQGKAQKLTNSELRAQGQDSKLGKMQSDQIMYDYNHKQKQEKQDNKQSKVINLKSQKNYTSESGKHVQESIVNKFKQAKNKDSHDNRKKSNDQDIPQVQQKQLYRQSQRQGDSQNQSQNKKLNEQQVQQSKSKHHNQRQQKEQQNNNSNKDIQLNSDLYGNQLYLQEEYDEKTNKYHLKQIVNQRSRSRSRNSSKERQQKPYKAQQNYIDKEKMNSNINNNQQVRQLEVRRNQDMSPYYLKNQQSGLDNRQDVQQKKQKVINLNESLYANLSQQSPVYDEKGYRILQPQRIQQTIQLERDDGKKESYEQQYTGRVLQLQRY